MTLQEAIDGRGPFAVWNLLTEDEQREAATALWDEADRSSRLPVELALAKEMKFRPQSVRRLSSERVAGRLVRMADTLPEDVVFQFLFHLHMAGRRALLAEFLDAVGLPHEDGVLDLPDGAGPPEPEGLATAARALIASHNHQGLVYLATLKVADRDFWSGLDPVLEERSDAGEPLKKQAKPKSKPKSKPKKK
jgi:hypothetical protein